MRHAAQTLDLSVASLEILLAPVDQLREVSVRDAICETLASVVRIFNLEPNAMRRDPGALEFWMRELLGILGERNAPLINLRTLLYEYANAWGSSEPDIEYEQSRKGHVRAELIARADRRWPLQARLKFRTRRIADFGAGRRFLTLTIAFAPQRPGHHRQWLPVLRSLGELLAQRLPAHSLIERYPSRGQSITSGRESAESLLRMVDALQAQFASQPTTTSELEILPTFPSPEVLDYAEPAAAVA